MSQLMALLPDIIIAQHQRIESLEKVVRETTSPKIN